MSLVYNVFYNLAKLIARCLFSMRVVHAERMIEEGPLILAVNHSSYFDPPLAGICSRRAVYYLARKNLLEWPLIGPLFPLMNVIPVEREGNDMSALREVIKKIREGNGVVLFPEGTRSKDGNLQPARAGSGYADAHFRCIPGISQRLTLPASHEDHRGDWRAAPLQPRGSCSCRSRNISKDWESSDGSNRCDQNGRLAFATMRTTYSAPERFSTAKDKLRDIPNVLPRGN